MSNCLNHKNTDNLVTICRILKFRGRVPNKNLSASDEVREKISAVIKSTLLDNHELTTIDILANAGSYFNGSPCSTCIEKRKNCKDCIEILPPSAWVLIAAARREWFENSKIGIDYIDGVNITLSKSIAYQLNDIDLEEQSNKPEEIKTELIAATAAIECPDQSILSIFKFW